MPKIRFQNNIKEAFQILSKEDDLSPNNEVVNKALGELVQQATLCQHCQLPCEHRMQAYSFDNDVNEILPSFRFICAKAEAEMEKYWCSKFNEIKDLAFSDLEAFIYFQNYVDIVEKEISLIQRRFNTAEPLNFIFAGSGALPLTAILFAKYCNFNITLLDMDEEAVNASELLLRKLNIPIRVMQGNAHNFDYSGYDLVFIASLIPEKERLVKRIKADGVKAYLTRGVDGPYQAFYSDLTPDMKEHQHIYLGSDERTLNSSYLFY